MANKLRVTLEVASRGINQFKKAQGAVDRFASRTMSAFRRLATIPNLVAGAAIVGIANSFVKAGNQIDIFRNQLRMVSNTAEEADVALAAIREFARRSPLDTEDVVQSYVRLRAVGIEPTIEQLETLGGVSLLFNRKLGDTLQAFVGMEKEPLRNLGIEIDRMGSKAIITSGNIRREVGKDAASIRAALLDVWAERFPDAMEKASQTFSAKMAIFRSNIFEFKAQVMDAFLNELGGGVDGINSTFDGLMQKIPEISFAIWAVITPVRILWNYFQMLGDFWGAVIVSAITAVSAGFRNMAIAISSAGNVLKSFGTVAGYVFTGQWGKIKGTVVDTVASIKSGLDQITDNSSGTFNELKAIAGEWWKGTDKNMDDIASSVENLMNKYNNLGKTVQRVSPQLPGSGSMGGGTDKEKGGSESKGTLEAVFSTYDSLEECDKEWRKNHRQGITELKEGTWEWLQVFGTSQERMVYKLKGVWTSFTDTIEGRLKTAFDTMTDLSSSWGDKFKALTQQVYRTSTNLLWDYVATYVKAKWLERTANVTSEKAKQAEALKTAAAEGAGAAAAAGKSVAGIPIVGPIMATAAIAAVAAAVFGLINKSKGFAVGTNYAPPGWHWVGERGPELMNFRGGEQVKTNRESMQMQQRDGGGQSVTFVFQDQSGGLTESMRGKIRSHEMDTVVSELLERAKQIGSV
ncbi:MAG: hypothetical protein ACLFVE_15100 [Chitinispirillaceae bacterium]